MTFKVESINAQKGISAGAGALALVLFNLAFGVGGVAVFASFVFGGALGFGFWYLNKTVFSK